MIINSLLDTDFYHYTQAQLLLHQHADSTGKDKFKCRNGTALPDEDMESFHTYKFMDRLNDEIGHLCTLTLSDGELSYLANIPFFKDDYIDFLSKLKLNREHIEFWMDSDGRLQGGTNGPNISTIWFETPVLAIISELNSEFGGPHKNDTRTGISRLIKNISMLKEMKDTGFQFADFGTRRRYSFDWQRYVLTQYKEHLPEGMLMGTSNVLFAKELDLKPIGTMSHKLFQIFQQLGRLEDHQEACLDAWAHEYRGDLGIALSDIMGFDNFLKSFDLYFAKLFDGCRHDSGDPYEWCHKLIVHYRSLGIYPRTKTAVFSDGLTIPKAIALFKEFSMCINVSFGIGTMLTNDMGWEALQIVMKMVECNGRPTAKISDSPGKGMCKDKAFLAYLKHIFNIS